VRGRARRSNGAAVVEDYAVYLTREPATPPSSPRGGGRGGDLVLAVGGDGTVNEVARGSSLPGRLGIVPVGSGNGLARALRVPLRPAHALGALESACPGMDVGFLTVGRS